MGYYRPMKQTLIITIDGPAGSGKSTIARMAAKERNLVYLDTGAMYRAVAYWSLKTGQTPESIAETLDFHIIKDGDGYRFTANGDDITGAIRTPEIDTEVSRIAQIIPVRKILVKKQQEYGVGRRIIMDGRDTGTVVFPDADLKFYFDASSAIRAQRRYDELTEKKITVCYDTIKSDIEERDYKDMHREWGALCVPENAIILDTSERSRQEVLELLLKHIDAYDR